MASQARELNTEALGTVSQYSPVLLPSPLSLSPMDLLNFSPRKDLALIAGAVGVVLILLLVTRTSFSSNRNGTPLPPGPPRRWLVGNAFDFPRLRSWVKFTEWRDRYGEPSPVDHDTVSTPCSWFVRRYRLC